jgi:GTPase SAR1 family protein
LEDSYKQPVWGKNDFKGRKEIIKKIKDNFLKKDSYHMVISGMGNSGKTSLIKYLHYNLFKNDEKLREKFYSELIEFEVEEDTDFSDFKKVIDRKKRLLEKKKNKGKIIFLDNYDALIDKFQEDFIKLINNYDKNNFLFVMTGQKGDTLLYRKYIDQFPRHTDFDNILGGLDESSEYINSAYLIDFVLSDIGLQSNYLNKGIKYEIVKYASGMPFLIKFILYELLSEWLNSYEKHPLKVEDVEAALLKIIESSKDYLIKRACDFDEMGYKRPEDMPQREVRIRDILNRISTNGAGTGRVRKEEIKNIVVINPDEEIVRQKKKSFDIKINQLKSMGFVIEYGEYLIGVPYMFFYKGERIIED